MTVTINGTTGITTTGLTTTGNNVLGDASTDTTNIGNNTIVTDGTGNVLIGGATSSSGFDSGADNLIIGNGSGNTGMTIYSGTTGVGSINFADGTSGSAIYAGGITYNHNDNRMDFATTDGSGRMRIDSSGNLLVGTTSSTIGSDNGFVAIKRAASGYSMILGSAQTGSVSYMIKFTYDNTTGTGQISTTNTTVSYATSSDYRLKENIAPMTGALATVSALKPVTYNWKVDGSDGQGFIAHELAEIIPDAVVGEKDAEELVDVKDEEGNVVGQETRPVYQGIDTSFLVATLTAAIQELKAELDTVKTELATLKGTV
jgi:hypothetical protein